MKYKVGDRVVYIGQTYFENGEVVTVSVVDNDDDVCTYKLSGRNGNWWVHNDDVAQRSTEDVASLTLEFPTEAMKEFADHCERAAAALERIKAALA